MHAYNSIPTIVIVILIAEGGSGNTYCMTHTIMYSHADI